MRTDTRPTLANSPIPNMSLVYRLTPWQGQGLRLEVWPSTFRFVILEECRCLQLDVVSVGRVRRLGGRRLDLGRAVSSETLLIADTYTCYSELIFRLRKSFRVNSGVGRLSDRQNDYISGAGMR